MIIDCCFADMPSDVIDHVFLKSMKGCVLSFQVRALLPKLPLSVAQSALLNFLMAPQGGALTLVAECVA